MIQDYKILDSIVKEIVSENYIYYIKERKQFVIYVDNKNCIVKRNWKEINPQSNSQFWVYVTDQLLINELIDDTLKKHTLTTTQINQKYIRKFLEDMVPKSIFDFDKDHDIFPLKNGFYNRKTNVLSETNPDYLYLNQYNVNYLPDCHELPENFTKFLWEIIKRGKDNTHDIDEFARILKILKSVILGELGKNKQMLIIYGVPNSGKGIIIRLIMSIVGNSFQNINLNTLEGRFEMSRCIGKRILIDTDCLSKIKPSTFSLLKKIVGNDSLRIEYMREHILNIENPEHTVVTQSIHVPQFPIEDQSPFLNHIDVIKMERSYEFKEYGKLEESLHGEQDQIFSYLINEIQNEQDTPQLPISIKEDIQSWYKMESDPIYKLIHTHPSIVFESKDITIDSNIEYLGSEVRKYLQEELDKSNVFIDLFNQKVWKHTLDLLRNCHVRYYVTRNKSTNIGILSNVLFKDLKPRR